ncbi:MAG TPA: Flp pilus assembly protein CpaB [Clostridia bacterium]|nr:Flp pilus assembly protein CpaB [Clostridia bacterium]
MESINKKILALSIIMALVTCLLLYFYISKPDNHSSVIEYTEIYAAKVEIPARTVVTDEMIVKVQFPKDAKVTMGLSDRSRIVGKLTKERIIKGEAILSDRLYAGEKTNMAFIIPVGKRAVTIGVNEVTEVGDYILPGDNVDVIATFEEAAVELEGRKIYYPKYTKVILQNVQVMGVGQNMQVLKEKGGKLPASVTLAVSLEEAEKLVLADESGVLRLALKPAADNSRIMTTGVIRDDMVIPKGKIEN